jgi:lipoprotein signal peptidase
MLFQNHGIAFGIPLPGVVSILISLGLIAYFARSYATARTHGLKIAALCILLGAASNLFDRVAHGFVIDYLLLFGDSAINLADILILSGLFLHVKYNADIN